MAWLECLARILNVSIVLVMLSRHSLANPPVIDFSHNMRILKVPNNTKVGSIIYRIKGTDADNDIITFGARGLTGNRLLGFKNVSFYEADVYLKIPFEEKEYKITIFATDGTYPTEVESTIIVTNSTSISESPFLSTENVIKIPENTNTNETIATISVREKESSNLPVTFELRGSNKFAIKYIFGPGGTSTAQIYLVETVDYEKQNLYVLTIVALNVWTNETFDTRNIAVIDKVFAIVDIQDTAPVFKNLANVVKIAENTKVGTVVYTLSAEDGDYGNQRNITYDIEQKSPLRSYFAIDEMKGSIVLRRSVLDIKHELGTKEPMILGVRAIEVINSEDSMPAMSTDSNIALVIVSIDNRRPKFKTEYLSGTVDENSQVMTPVRWEGGSVPQINDDDPGLNGTIIMHISDPSDTFMIRPERGLNEIVFSIVVKNSSKLDYETSADKQFSIKVMATDQSPYIPLNSTIFCTIKLIDLNDNIPQFSQKLYEVFIPEDALPGTTVSKIIATDLDKSGDYGEVSFTINGPLSNNLQIDSKTGIILLTNIENIDREVISEYRMTIEARDESGRGNKNVTELHIRILDANDNAPVFLQPRYDAVLDPNKFSLAQPLVVKALDADEPDNVNSRVSYEIIGGNWRNRFVINESSGEITLNSSQTIITNNIDIEYETIKTQPEFILTIRAYDHGIPHQSSTVLVYILNPNFLNRNISFIIDDSVPNVQNRIELIESGISSLIGSKVHIYLIKPHNNDKKVSEVLARIAYSSHSSVDLKKTPLILSQIIGKNYTSREIKEEKSAMIAGNDLKLIYWLLIILILATLVFLIIFLICWFCCCRDRIRKREKLEETKESNYTKVINGSVVKDNTSNDKKHKKSKHKRKASIKAWTEESEDERLRRPSSAPNNEQNRYNRSVRANSSQSFQDQYLSNNPTFYQRVHKLNRHQRSRVGPQYYDTYDTNGMHSSLSDYRNAYNAYNHQNPQFRSFKGIDNTGYLRTTNEPFIVNDLNGHNSIQRTRQEIPHLSYNEKLATVPKRTEILYIQSPVETQEDLLRSISQNETRYNEEQGFGRHLVVQGSHTQPESGRESDRSDRLRFNSKPKQRLIYFNDHNVSDMIIPEDVAVPGMVPNNTQENQELLALESTSGPKQTIRTDEDKQMTANESNTKDMVSNDSTIDLENTNQNELTNGSESANLGLVAKSSDIENEIVNYSPYYDETIQITSVSGVPVSIELKEGVQKIAHKSHINGSISNANRRSAKNTRLLNKQNSFDNSEKSYDSDSGIGRSVPNPKVNFDMKNSGLMEKKSIFTIAYNDVKTRHLQSAESNPE